MQPEGTLITVSDRYQFDGDKLRALLDARRMSITYVELAQRVGISLGYLYMILNGDRRPSVRIIGRMEEVLGVPAEQLGATGLPPRDPGPDEVTA